MQVIKEFASYTEWLDSLEKLSESDWNEQINSEKWSIKQIVLHIAHWDNHLLNVIIPSVKNGEGMIFPDFDSFNARATKRAEKLTGDAVLKESLSSRQTLVNMLESLSEETLTFKTSANGVSHDPNQGVPYSLHVIIEEFIGHDRHHMKQVESILK
ncbi:DinB family protein [Exiguobacterium sp. SRB7LM]|uniref:DinB family protein n=1 Tax=Exiguobacterium sp. SRB7LM TaxID=2608401 RepID=UPI0018C3B56D|nr:DinB family protein [Exiguobacterium sp. SRB7LM]MBG0917015.1 DinB family protein [Exiguobacterium sp. SRB7LM]